MSVPFGYVNRQTNTFIPAAQLAATDRNTQLLTACILVPVYREAAIEPSVLVLHPDQMHVKNGVPEDMLLIFTRKVKL